MPWQSAGVTESPFVTVFRVAGISSASFLMNAVVLSAALSGANASLYATARMLFSLARSRYAPARMGVLNQHGVPMGAVLASMLGIVLAIILQLFTPEGAYLYIIGAALAGGMLAWLVSLLAHVRFRRTVSDAQLKALGLRSPLGAAGSIAGFIAIVAAILLTWRVPQSRITVVSAGPYLLGERFSGADLLFAGMAHWSRDTLPKDPLVDAWLAVHPDDRAGARALLDGLVGHLGDACVGSVSEVFDAEPPFTPRGCIAQAWGVAELLRALVKTAG